MFSYVVLFTCYEFTNLNLSKNIGVVILNAQNSPQMYLNRTVFVISCAVQNEGELNYLTQNNAVICTLTYIIF